MSFDTTTVDNAIITLENTSIALQKVANNPVNYNSEFAYYLDIMSNEIRAQANKLREQKFALGGLL